MANLRTLTSQASNIILLVEDNEDDVQLTRRAFDRVRVANGIVVVRDGQEALDYLFGPTPEDGPANPLPQVVLLDLQLPRVSGLDVLRQIRSNARTRLLPVVILTSSREEQDLVAGYSLGANSYVGKPVDFNQFVDAAQQLGLYWLVLNEKPPTVGRP